MKYLLAALVVAPLLGLESRIFRGVDFDALPVVGLQGFVIIPGPEGHIIARVPIFSTLLQVNICGLVD